MKELIGKTVNKLFVGDQESFLVFITDQGDVIFETEADCCSETWFADLLGVKALLGNKVITVEDVSIAEIEDGRNRQAHDKFYGVKITTKGGYTDIIYRNSSNGYYEGECQFTLRRPDTMTEITDDWSA